MDFFDPDAHRSHTKRLFLGYLLFAVIVGLVTWILLYRAQGFRYDPKSGFFTQQGVLYINSQPTGAAIYLNDQLFKDKTNTSTTLDQGTYVVQLVRDGYRSWQRRIELEGGTVVRFDYALLFPRQLNYETVANFAAVGALVPSPNREWIVVQPDRSVLKFELRALNRPEVVVRSFTVGNGVLPQPETITVDWTEDSTYLHVGYVDTNGTLQYEKVHRSGDTPQLAVHTLTGSTVQKLINSRSNHEQYVSYEQNGGILRTVDTKNGTVSGPIANSVVAYDMYGDEVIYATVAGQASGSLQLQTYKDGNTSTIATLLVDDASSYWVRVFTYDGDWYYVLSSQKDKVVRIYKNVRNFIANDSQTNLTPSVVVRFENVQQLLLSPSKRFIVVQHNELLATYDLQTNQLYRFSLPTEGAATAAPVGWMDDYRIYTTIAGALNVVDFDGSNLYELADTETSGKVVVNKSAEELFVLSRTSSASQWQLQRASLLVR